MTVLGEICGLALREISDTWKNPGSYWSAARREFAIHFLDRFQASSGYVVRTARRKRYKIGGTMFMFECKKFFDTPMGVSNSLDGE